MPADPLDALRLPRVPVEPREEFASALLRRIEAGGGTAPGGAMVRYFVTDMDTAVDFYRGRLGFSVELRPARTFALLRRGELRLILSVAEPGGHHVMPDGAMPEPGGWNRISLRVSDLDATVAALRGAGARLRTDIVTAPAVRQVLLQDPSGNLVELFEPLEAR